MAVLLLAATVATSACTRGDSTAGSTHAGTSSAIETGSGSTQATTTAPPPLVGPGPKRDCDERVSGDLGRDWRSQTILVGPVGFVARAYRTAPPADFAALRTGRYRAQKVLLLVRRGTKVTLMLVPHARAPQASLLYDPSKWTATNAYRITTGDDSMTFRACEGEFGVLPHNYTQFNGAFLVAGPGCVPVDFRVAGEPRHFRANLSFGAGACS